MPMNDTPPVTSPMDLPGIGRYRRFGRGRPVVILSNPQADPNWWAAPFVSALVNSGYEAIPFIHAGDSYAPMDVVRDVATFIEHLDTEPVRLLGWSQGAAIAQEVALLRPDLVTAAALIATYGRQNSVDRLLQDAWAALEPAGDDLDPVRLALLFLTSYPPQSLGDDAFVGPLADGMRAWSVNTADSREPRHRSVGFITAYQERLSDLAGMQAPCLVMGFGQDADTFVTRAREVAESIPASRYLELPDAGHLTPVTEPQRVIAPV